MLQRDAVRCSVMHCFGVCCSVLQCAAVRCSALQCVAVCCSMLKHTPVCCGGLWCVAVCCSRFRMILSLNSTSGSRSAETEMKQIFFVEFPEDSGRQPSTYAEVLPLGPTWGD